MMILKNKIFQSAVSLACLLSFVSPAMAEYDSPIYEEGLERMSHRDFDGAILSFNQAVGANNRNARAYFKRGQCFYYLQNFQLAIDDLSAAIAVDPKNSEFYLWRGATYCKMGDDPHSIMDYEEALRADPALLKAASAADPKAALEGKSVDAASGKSEPLIKNAPNEKSIRNYLDAVKIVNEGLLPKFVSGTVFGGIVRPEFPGDQTAPYLRPADLDKIVADPKTVAEACRKSLATNPRDGNGHFRFALAMQLLNKPQKALEEFGDAIFQEPSNIQYMLARAFFQHKNNNDAMAKVDIEKSRLIDPTIPKNLSF